MYSNNYKFKYLEWYTPEEIHQHTLTWLSTLDFMTHEHEFFVDMLKDANHFIQEAAVLEKIKSLLSALAEHKKKALAFKPLLKDHQNDLEVLVDGVNEIQKEKAFKDQHLLYSMKFDEINSSYRQLKYEVFDLLRRVIKTRKQQSSLK